MLGGSFGMASPTRPTSARIHFGLFELDPAAGTIHKGGIPIKLQPQPYRVLLLLIANAGQVVSREKIQQHLWGDSTFVDFERGINFSINQIRAALCDSAEKPRYIQTLPRVGYRFVPLVTYDTPDTAQPVSGVLDWPKPALEVATPRRPGHPHIDLPIGPLKPLKKRGFVAVVIILLLLMAGFLLRWQHRHSDDQSIRSLAVLPLDNVSGDPSQDYFADGMTDAMITDLGKNENLRVISRTSAMQYKGIHKPLPQIARELNVDAVVEGTVLRSGDRVRITAQLVDAHADKHLWAQSYEGNLGNVLELQSNVASAIASQIQAKLTPKRSTLSKQQFTDADAEDAYLKGRYFEQKGTIEDLQQAITYFKYSTDKEPSQALPYAALASTYVSLGHILFLSPQKAFVPAKNAALKALSIDDSSTEAHTALANIKFLYDWDFGGADREFQLALQLNPNFVQAHSAYAGFLNAMGKSEEAMTRIQRAVEIDPLSLGVITDVAWELYWARRYDEAIAQARKVVDINPNYYPAHVCLGLSYEQKHDFSSAISELSKATGFCRDKCFGLIGQVSALSGDRSGAMRALEQLQKRTYVSPWLVAIVYTELGDKDQAFNWLERAYQGREHDLAYSNVWPMFDSLRSDARFQDLERRIGLPRSIPRP
jgi:TolB-like protein/DNA-binding winged helix-turn-helix (wHTH) protein/Tfp pilus assembly protein PilF